MEIEQIIEATKAVATPRGLRRIEEMTIHYAGYAEPGYEMGSAEVVVLGNWNPVRLEDDQQDEIPSKLFDSLTAAGAECEWNDEWTTCDTCSKLIRTSPDCYDWTPSYDVFDGGYICIECVKENPEDILLNYEGNPEKAWTFDVDPEEYGYVKANEESYAHGFHSGQDDSPAAIAKWLEAKDVFRYIFQISNKSQFDMHFDFFVHESEMSLLNGKIPHGKTEIEPATAMKQALADASLKMAELQGDGIKYARCKPDGTADVRLISNQEFIDGIKS